MKTEKFVKSSWGPLAFVAGATLWILFLAVGPVHAQSTGWGTIIGRVIDPSSAVVPDVEVKLRNEATNVTATAMTNATGDYAFSNVIPGTYEVSFTAKGFKPYIANHLVMYVSHTVRQDATLTVGTATQIVTVTSALPLVQTTTLGSSIEGEVKRKFFSLDGWSWSLSCFQPHVTRGEF